MGYRVRYCFNKIQVFFHFQEKEPLPPHTQFLRIFLPRAGNTAQQLRALDALAEELGLIDPSIYLYGSNLLTLNMILMRLSSILLLKIAVIERVD